MYAVLNISVPTVNNISNSEMDSIEFDSRQLKLASFLCAVLIIPIAIIGFLGNMITIYVFTRPHMRSSINILFTGLATIDSVLLLVGTPLFSSMGINGYVEKDDEISIRIQNYLVIYGYPVAMMAQSASVWCLFVITSETYLAICYPLKARLVIEPKRAIFALKVIGAVALAYNVCRFWEYRITDNALCPVLRENVNYVRYYVHWLYFFLIYLIPFLVLVIFNSLTVRGVKQARIPGAHLTRQQRQEHEIVFTVVCVIGVFFVCNSLAFVLNGMEAMQPENCFKHQRCYSLKNEEVEDEDMDALGERCLDAWPVFYFLMDANNLLVEVNSAVNFFIYYAFSRRFRKNCHRLFAYCFDIGRDSFNIEL